MLVNAQLYHLNTLQSSEIHKTDDSCLCKLNSNSCLIGNAHKTLQI